MQIGDRWGQGVIVNLEKDNNKPFWIEVQYPGGASPTRINITGGEMNVDLSNKRWVRVAFTDYHEMNDEYKRMREENERLIEENAILKVRINNLLNGK